MPPRRFRSLVFFLLAPLFSCRAEVTLPPLISDNMVLQQNTRTSVWGQADVGENVTVKIGGQSVAATADADGNWAVKLDGIKAGGPYEMTIEGKNTDIIHNVAAGEVWLCAGESNMAMKVPAARQAAEEIAKASYPMLRAFSAEQGAWTECSPETVKDFSATGYFFGRELNQTLHVPVGLIESTRGSTSIDAWMPKGAVYEELIAPLTRFPIRGALWYQGESDTGNARLYRKLFPQLITGWRKAWGDDDLPFLYVQLAPFLARHPAPTESRWAELREAQAQTLSVPGTGMAVAIDTGGEYTIHPDDKQDVGHRLFLLAEDIVYGRAGVASSGPTCSQVLLQGGKAILTFQHAEGGLVAKHGAPLKGFALAGEDKRFVWADASIHGGKVILQSKEVPKPAAVRYAWADAPDCNLSNKAGLPALPFRSDPPPAETAQ